MTTATRCQVVDGGTIELILSRDDGGEIVELCRLPLGAADACTLAYELLSAARRHQGRAQGFDAGGQPLPVIAP